MDELETTLVAIVKEHGMMKVLAALTGICFVISNKELATGKREDYFPYHGWRQLARRLRKATDHASDLRDTSKGVNID